jgi:hypothetical protein
VKRENMRSVRKTLKRRREEKDDEEKSNHLFVLISVS